MCSSQERLHLSWLIYHIAMHANMMYTVIFFSHYYVMLLHFLNHASLFSFSLRALHFKVMALTTSLILAVMKTIRLSQQNICTYIDGRCIISWVFVPFFMSAWDQIEGFVLWELFIQCTVRLLLCLLHFCHNATVVVHNSFVSGVIEDLTSRLELN